MAKDVITQADVAIINAGLAGLTTAYLLAQERREVVIIDDLEQGTDEADRIMALTPFTEISFLDFYEHFGAETTLLIGESYRAALDAIESIAFQEKIPCQFERVQHVVMAAHPDQNSMIHQEYEATQKAGFKHVTIEARPHPQGAGNVLALSIGNQARFRPGIYRSGLVQALRRKGVTFHTHQEVESIEALPDTNVRVQFAGGGAIIAREVIRTTGEVSPVPLYAMNEDERSPHILDLSSDFRHHDLQGTIAGLILSDRVSDRLNVWQNLYFRGDTKKVQNIFASAENK